MSHVFMGMTWKQTSYDFMVMTWKQRSNLHSGRAKHPPDPKKLAKFDPKSRCCSQFFFDASGVVHHEYLPEGSTVNQTYNIEVLKRLRNAIRRKTPNLWRSCDWFFHHDNAPAHSALRTRNFLAKHSITVLSHSPYSHMTLLHVISFCSPCSKNL